MTRLYKFNLIDWPDALIKWLTNFKRLDRRKGAIELLDRLAFERLAGSTLF
jgi:hypothetical protein